MNILSSSSWGEELRIMGQDCCETNDAEQMLSN